ncbi:MAG TPA: hypothetical protein VG897_07035 [Terriglobales bacterium]|nr:hypothetical protein [Terriglobales bacterium]
MLNSMVVLRSAFTLSITENRMRATGELIRLMNYVDDITTTLRRITANITSMTEDERKRLADYMRKADEKFQQTIASVEQSK